MSTEVDSQKYYSSTIERTNVQDSRLGEINVPNAGAIHNPTIEKKANELAEQNGGKRRLRSICGTFWCEDYEFRQQQFDFVLKVWGGELRFISYGAIEKTEENKKSHCHFLIMFNGNKQWKTIIKTLDPHLYHIEAARKPNAAHSYCKKEDPDNVLEWGDPPKQGARTDLKKIMEECNYEIERIQNEYTNEFMRYKNGFERCCEVATRGKRVLTKLDIRFNEETKKYEVHEEKRAEVEWHCGPAGAGKTLSVKQSVCDALNEGECTPETITMIDQIQNEFFIGDIAEKTDIMIIDDFRGSDMKYSHLLKTFDGRNCPIKGGQRFIKAKKIYVTSSMTPEQCYENLDARDGIGQLQRRIKQVYKYEPVENDETEF